MNRREQSPHPEAPGGTAGLEGQAWTRRALGIGAGASALAVGAVRSWADEPSFSPVETHLRALETTLQGRLGLYAVDMGSQRVVERRADERFAMCSSFKASLVAAALERVDRGTVSLDQAVAYGPADLLSYAPVARAHLAEGRLSIRALCAGAVELSDNTCANKLLEVIGGPAALTRRWRAWGDAVTRLDRTEPELNSAIPGDPRDTTAPHAMATTLGQLLLGEVLRPASRALLLGWMRRCQTGQTKIRARLPADVVVADKTGNNGKDAAGDIALVERPGRAPILIAVYVAEAKVDQARQDAVIAEAARRAVAELTDV